MPRIQLPRRALAALVASVLLVALLAPSGAGAVTNGFPDSIAAIGDSITQATNLSGADIGANPEHSWSTGYDSGDGIVSHYERILANNAAISGNNFNVSVNGAKMDDAPGQASNAVGTGAEYVTFLMGGNDVCTSSVSTMTSVASYEADFRTSMDTLTAGLPNAQIFVASVPDVYQLWSLFKNDRNAKRTWKTFGICQSLLSESNTEADRQAVRTRNIEFNQVLAAVCAEYAACLYDGDATFDYQFTKNDVSSFDYFHPSKTGQKNLAANTWAVGYWPTS
jgi:lysophospholipase L1-like esterase